MSDSVSQAIGEYVTNGVQAMREDIMAELKEHGKARLTFVVSYKMTDGGDIDVELARRFSHGASVAKTSIGRLKQTQLPGM